MHLAKKVFEELANRLPEGFLEVRELTEGDPYKELAVSFRIGDVDVTLSASGEFYGGGRRMGEAKEWELRRVGAGEG